MTWLQIPRVGLGTGVGLAGGDGEEDKSVRSSQAGPG